MITIQFWINRFIIIYSIDQANSYTHSDNKRFVDAEQTPGSQSNVVISNFEQEKLGHLVGAPGHGAYV